MAITRPTTKTVISTTNFGIPVVDEVNRLGTVITPTAWTDVTFQNGWVNYGGVYAPVQKRKVGDIVYLRGVMKSGLTNNTAFTLPVGFRPPMKLQWAGQAAGQFAFFEIDSTGLCYVTGSNVAYGIQCDFSTTA